VGMRRVWIYFRGKLIKHDKGDGHLYPWIAIRLNESHEIFRVLRDRGFFGRDVEGYIVLSEDTLREVLGDELFNKLIRTDGEGGSPTAPAPLRVGTDRGVSLGDSL